MIDCKLDLSTPNDDFYNDCNVSPLKDFRAAIGLKPTSSNKKRKKKTQLVAFMYIYKILFIIFCLNQRLKQRPLVMFFSFSTPGRKKCAVWTQTLAAFWKEEVEGPGSTWGSISCSEQVKEPI